MRTIPCVRPAEARIRLRFERGTLDTAATRTCGATTEAAAMGRSEALAKLRSSNKAGFRGAPPLRISKCRCGPVESPVLPMAPSGSPALIGAPTLARAAPRWA